VLRFTLFQFVRAAPLAASIAIEDETWRQIQQCLPGAGVDADRKD
jgi:hypothetical protein